MNDTTLTNAGLGTITTEGYYTTLTVEVPHNLVSTKETSEGVLDFLIADIEELDAIITDLIWNPWKKKYLPEGVRKRIGG